MNILKTILGLSILAIINTIYIKYFSIFGIMPNIAAIIIVLLGSRKGIIAGGCYGVFIGLLNDILIGTTFGLYGLIYMYVGFVSGAVANKMYNENIVISALIIGLSDIFYNVIMYFYYYLQKDYSFINYLLKITIPEMLYTVCAFIVVNFIVNGVIKEYNRGF